MYEVPDWHFIRCFNGVKGASGSVTLMSVLTSISVRVASTDDSVASLLASTSTVLASTNDSDTDTIDIITPP